ncbi:Prolyl endopeptidase [Hondaea fermentalgiana]|uniref:Prolyl endopeptidase n=1 Tax=Hondaea fermentalgiana TaxID=2315210 RepID=A0A2R5GHV9_9STRA|nr:Prolyl endopeptidase [Hondaea fermentalgiana]|eukprot:GBG29308.1 Prolyl endopeptidase [Hondaea fermentalgiana]
MAILEPGEATGAVETRGRNGGSGGGGGGSFFDGRGVKLAFGAVSALGLLAASRMRGRALSDKAASVPPVAEKRPTKVLVGKVEGQNRGANPMDPPKELMDDYFWMRDDDRKAPEVIAHLRRENAYCEYQTRHLKPLSKALYKDLLSHVKETEDSVPYPYGDYWYYSRTIKGKSYRIYCRAKSEEEVGSANEEILLDMNKEAKGKKHCDLGGLSPSPDHQILAYSLDETGFETYNAKFFDTRTGRAIPEKLPELTGRLVWGKDNESVFYAVHDEAHRPYKLYWHRMGTDFSEDKLLHEESNEEYWMGFGKSLSGRFIMCESGTAEATEIRILDLETAQFGDEMTLVHARTDGLRYSLDHCGDKFYIVTNADGAKNQKLMSAPVEDPRRENWTDVIPYDPDVNIEDTTAFANHLIVEGREGGFTAIWLLDQSGAEPSLKKIEGFPDAISSVGLGVNRVFDTNTVRVMYESMVTPPTTYDIDMQTQDMRLVHRKEVPNYDPELYHCERLEARGHDGVMIPMSMVYRKDVGFEAPRESRTPGPVYLSGYGSYGICNEPDFTPSFITLMDYGICCVVAHIRGGGEMGRPWYEDHGKYLQKKNTFYDFISCAEHLIAEKYTEPEQLGITGRSAGGLLMGAVLNMAPHLFKCCIAGVPFVDVVATMSDTSIPLTTGEFTEWGNVNEEKYFEYMLSYSPINNVTAQDYPSILVTAGLFDPRVAYWEPAKWVAHLRDKKTDDNLLLLKVDLSSGHFSASDRYKYIREKAFEFAYLVEQLGVSRL